MKYFNVCLFEFIRTKWYTSCNIYELACEKHSWYLQRSIQQNNITKHSVHKISRSENKYEKYQYSNY